jgi:hypothetical protein
VGSVAFLLRKFVGLPMPRVPPDNWRPQSAPQLGAEPVTNLTPAKRENLRLRRRSAMLRAECKQVFRHRPDPVMLKALLAEAERSVTAGQEAVERQRSIVKNLERDGQDDKEARVVLHDLLNTQALHVLTRDRLFELTTD